MSHSELLKLERAAIEMAETAGAAAMRHWRNLRKIEEKSDTTDLVTEADVEVEKLLHAEVERLFPGHSFIGEETQDQLPDTLDAMPEHAWIIDPIDGTTNFAHGHEQFSVSIAYWRAGVPTVGVVSNPPRAEIFHAIRGLGARLNGRPIHVSVTKNLEQALSVTGYGYDRRRDPEKYINVTRTLLVNTQGLRRYGSAALDFCGVARGVFDVYAELNLKIWDAAAGTLIVEEAGGRTSGFDGQPIRLWPKSILATNGHLYDAALRMMQPTRAAAGV